MIAPDFGLVGVTPGIIDGVDHVEQYAIGPKRFAAHRHDDRRFGNVEQPRFICRRGASAQTLNAALDSEPAPIEKTVEGKARRGCGASRQPDTVRHRLIDDRAMDRCRDAINEA